MNDIYVGTLFSDAYLEHHGILGMKWGKRNGPPYPLGINMHSAAEKAAGWMKSLRGRKKEKDFDEKGNLTDSGRRRHRVHTSGKYVKEGVKRYNEYVKKGDKRRAQRELNMLRAHANADHGAELVKQGKTVRGSIGRMALTSIVAGTITLGAMHVKYNAQDGSFEKKLAEAYLSPEGQAAARMVTGIIYSKEMKDAAHILGYRARVKKEQRKR